MAWSFAANSLPSIDSGALDTSSHFDLKEFLKAHGWSVVAGGEGSFYYGGPPGTPGYSMTADVITSAFYFYSGAWVGGPGAWRNPESWYVLQWPPLGGVTRRWCVQHDGGRSYRIKYATTSFTGGSPSASRVPSAADEVVLLGSGTDAAPGYSPMYTNNAGNYRSHHGCDPATGACYSVGQFISTGGVGVHALYCDPLAPGALETLDADPVVLCATTGLTTASQYSNDAAGAASGGWQAWLAKGLAGAGFVGVGGLVDRMEAGAVTVVPATGLPINPHSGRDDLYPIDWVRRGSQSAPSGRKGTGTALRWVSTTRSVGQRYQVTGLAHEYLSYGPVAIPWPASAANFFNAAAPVAATLVSFGAPATPAPTPPVVSGVTPAVGSTIGARTALGLDVTDADGLRRVLLVARFPALGLVEVVHDGDAFAPLYAPDSTRTALASGYRYSLLRATGWPAAPTLTPYAIDVAGAENA